MKTTVKLDSLKAVVVEPNGSKIRLTLTLGGVPVNFQDLTLDQWHALSFGGDMAAEVIAQREGAAA